VCGFQLQRYFEIAQLALRRSKRGSRGWSVLSGVEQNLIDEHDHTRG
jgi:hypothetical protein